MESFLLVTRRYTSQLNDTTLRPLFRRRNILIISILRLDSFIEGFESGNRSDRSFQSGIIQYNACEVFTEGNQAVQRGAGESGIGVETNGECDQNHCNYHDQEAKYKVQPLLDHEKKICRSLAGIKQARVLLDVVMNKAYKLLASVEAISLLGMAEERLVDRLCTSAVLAYHLPKALKDVMPLTVSRKCVLTNRYQYCTYELLIVRLEGHGLTIKDS
jgi:hypothetical protein